MNNVVLSTRNIDELISDIATEVVKKIEFCTPFPPEQEKDLLTIDEAAEFLSLTKPTLYSKVSRRELPFMKRGKRLYFSREKLMEYVKEGSQKTNAEVESEAGSYLKRK